MVGRSGLPFFELEYDRRRFANRSFLALHTTHLRSLRSLYHPMESVHSATPSCRCFWALVAS
jgi:hypothetical protein